MRSDNQGDKLAALGAYERAIALQSDFTMWQRNRAGTLIELGRLADPEADLAAAQANAYSLLPVPCNYSVLPAPNPRKIPVGKPVDPRARSCYDGI